MKRGQITVFIILGLVVLLIVGLLFLVLKDSGPGNLESTQESVAVTNLVQQCLNQIGEETTRTVASNGGYLDITLKDLPTADSQVIAIGPQRIAIWHEVQDCSQSRTGCLQDNRPPLCAKDSYCPIEAKGDNSIQQSIERGIERDINNCLNSFSSLPGIQVETQGNPAVKAYIRNDDLGLNLEYPLRVTTADGNIIELEEFTATLDVNLPQVYLLASQIQQEQRERMFIEEIFLHLLSYQTGVDKELPPFRELQISGAPRFWIRPEVQQIIEDGLLPALFMIRVKNADNYYPIESPDVAPEMRDYAEGLYDYMAINLGNVYYPVDVRFEYPGTPMHLDINGKQLLKPRRMPGTAFLSWAGMDIHDYRFKYAASFPLLIHIDDPAAFNGRGLQLNFGLEANILNNVPLNTSIGYTEIAFGQTGVNLEQQTMDHLYRVTVHDERKGTPVSDAQLTYSCGIEYTVGETDHAGTWEGELPFCLGKGYLLAWRDGYERDGVVISNFDDDGMVSDHRIELWPFIAKTVKVYKLTATDVGNITLGSSREQRRTGLGVNDSLALAIQRQKEHELQDDVPLQSMLQFGGGSSTDKETLLEQLEAQRDEIEQADPELYEVMLQAIHDMEEPSNAEFVQSQIIELIPGTYDIEGRLIYSGLIQIPEETRETGPFYARTKYTLPAQNFTSWMSGGVVLKDGMTELNLPLPGAFVIHADDLYAENELVFYALEQPLPTKWDELEKYQSIEEYQLYKNAYAKPEFRPAAP